MDRPRWRDISMRHEHGKSVEYSMNLKLHFVHCHLFFPSPAMTLLARSVLVPTQIIIIISLPVITGQSPSNHSRVLPNENDVSLISDYHAY
jgi:hypothetical protein